MQTLLRQDCWCTRDDSSTDFTSERANRSGMVEKWILCYTRCCTWHTFRPVGYDIYEQYVLAAHIWMIALFLFVQRAGDDVMIK